MRAATEGDISLMRAELDRGVAVDLNAGHDFTPLVASIRAQNVEGVRLLLERGANPNLIVTAQPVMYFAVAEYKGDPRIISLLVEHGADPTTKLWMGYNSNETPITPYDMIMDHKLDMYAHITEVRRLMTAAASKYRREVVAQEAAVNPSANSAASGPGLTRSDMEQIVKSAVAAAKPATAPVPEAAPEITSDVDAPSYKVPANPDAFAFLVGAEKYNTLPEARFAERDAKAMAAHLVAMGYPQRNIVTLLGAQATKTGMIKNLEAWLPNNVNEKSTVFFYFSGHGAPDANTSLAYLVPVDGDPQYLEETAYPVKRLYEKLAALKAKRVVVALDSCFSGTGGRSVLAKGTRPLVGKLKTTPMAGKIVALSASASDEITGAMDEQGHGLFTYQLLKALTETAGRGSVGELYETLKPRVQDEARRQNRMQTPQLTGAALDAGLR